MAIVSVQSKTFLVNAASATISMDAPITPGSALIIQTLGAGNRTYSYDSPDGPFISIRNLATVSFRSQIHAIYNITGGFSDLTAEANTLGDRWVTVVEVSGLGASPTVRSGESETDIANQNVTTHDCAVPGIDGLVGEFVIAGGRLNADPGTLTRHPGLSNDYQIPNFFGLTQWGVLSTEYLADTWAYTSSGTRQNVNTAAVFGPTVSDTTAPTLESATIDETGEILTLIFSEPVTGSVGISVTGTEGAITLVHSGGSGSTTYTYALSRPAERDEVFTLDYVPGDIEDTSENPLAVISDRLVTNGSEYQPPPALFSVVITVDGVTEATIESATVPIVYTPLGVGNYVMTVTRFSSNRVGVSNAIDIIDGAVTVNNFTRDAAIFDSGAQLGLTAADIPLTGTANPGAVIQGRAYSLDDAGASSTDWIDIATTDSNGDWSGNLLNIPKNTSYYRAEVRLKTATTVTAATTNKFAVGHIVAWWGQSEDARVVKQFFDQAPDAVPVADDDTLQVVFDERNDNETDPSNPEYHRITAANPVTKSFASIANTLYEQTAGEKFLLVCMLKSGTGFDSVVDDSLLYRLWTSDLAIHNLAITEPGQEVGLAVSSWYAAPGSYGTDYMEWFSRVFLGRDLVGTPITPPTSVTIGSNTIDFDHTVADLYDYTYTRWMLCDPHTFVPTQTLSNAVTNDDTSQNTSLLNKQQVRETVRSFLADPVGVVTLNEVETLRWDPTSRGKRIPTERLKVPGVDALPSGFSFNGSSITLSNGVTAGDGLFGWDFTGVKVTIQGRCPFIRDCLFQGPVTFWHLDIYPTANIDDISWNTFIADGYRSGLSTIINGRTSGTPGVDYVAPTVRKIYRNSFHKGSSDYIKSTWSGEISWNYFDTPVNLPFFPDLWDNATTYQTDDLVRTEADNNKYYFRSLTDDNIGNQPPTSKTDTAFWLNLDPHVDTLNPKAIGGEDGEGLLIRANYINMHNGNREIGGGYAQGLNNAIRAAVNSGETVIANSSIFEYNIMTRDDGENSFPTQFASQDPHTLRYNWITPNVGDELWYSGDELTNTMIGNISHVTNLTDPRGWSFDSVLKPLGLPMLTYSNGVLVSPGVWGDQSHPSADTNDGLVRKAALFANNMLLGLRATDWIQPTFDKCEWQSNGAYVEVWSSHGPVTTTRIANSESALPATYPHWQPVVGWEVNGQPATNVQLVNGRVRIYKNQAEDPFDSNDTINCGRGAASGQLLANEDNIAQLWKDLPIVDVGQPGVEGIPLLPLPDPAVLANTIPGAPTFTVGATGPYFLDTATLGSGVGSLVFYAKVKFSDVANAYTLFFLSASQINVRRLNNNGGVDIVAVRDAAGTIVIDEVLSSIIPTDAFTEILLDIDLVNQECICYINGVLSDTATVAVNSGAFADNRNLVFLAQNNGSSQAECEVESLKVWKNETVVDGVQPATTPYKVIEGDAATVNADPWKQGSDAT